MMENLLLVHDNWSGDLSQETCLSSHLLMGIQAAGVRIDIEKQNTKEHYKAP